MPALKNARHEAFARELAKGKAASQAYVAAGYSPNEGNAIRLKGNEKVAERVAELTEKAADRAVVDKAWILERLKQNAETCMTMDFVRGPNGQPTTAVTHNPAAANKALELLGKELGMFKDQHELTSPDGSMTPPATIQIIGVRADNGNGGDPAP